MGHLARHAGDILSKYQMICAIECPCMILSPVSACPVVDLAARVVEDIQLNNGLRENTWFCGQNACNF